ncbi:MAG: hypothetical protein ABJE95_37985 [Byssovorax sp.]
MLVKRRGWTLALLLISSCTKPGRDVVAEAEALAAQGKGEEAARLFDLACCHTPEGEKCASSDRRAAEARITAAEKAMGAGQFLAAERLLILARATADEGAAQKARERLVSEDLMRGTAYERALTLGKTPAAQKAMEAVAATKTPAAALAKAWLDKERPAIVLGVVKAACGPEHEGSCSKATTELRAAALTGPESDEATAIADAEERRIYPLRINAETFLQSFVAESLRNGLLEMCMAPPESMGARVAPDAPKVICLESHLDPGHCMPREKVEEQLQYHRINETAWLRAMKAIADPELVAPLEERKKKAQRFTPDDPKIARLDVPKPRPAPKAAGAKK